jgi:hypothetical protein
LAGAIWGDHNRFGKTPVTIYGEGFTEELDMLSFDMVLPTFTSHF